MKVHCLYPLVVSRLATALGGKNAAPLIRSAVGRTAARSPFVTAETTSLGLVIGKVVDPREDVPHCTACGVAPQVLVAAL